jgi:twitching motility protein PilT
VLPAASDEAKEWLRGLIARSLKVHASDLMLVVGSPPAVRINDKLEYLGETPLSAEATALLCAGLVPPARRQDLEAAGAIDFSFQWSKLGRCRCNVHRERNHWAAAVRLLPSVPPALEDLRLPEQIGRFADLRYGLVLVTGPTGSGKSTTLAALVRRILSKRHVHLVTIEDPIEFEHRHAGSVVEHIEVGRDASSFAGALRSSLRQDPDVLLVGEMRDRESISIAITAAETGHLVLSTLHTGDAPQTVHRILDSYPAEQASTVRAQLSISLAAVISQQLLPRSDGRGRVPAVEVLVATSAVRNLIRNGKIEQLRSQLTLERRVGMLELDRSLARLASDGLVGLEEARSRARIPSEFEQFLTGDALL